MIGRDIRHGAISLSTLPCATMASAGDVLRYLSESVRSEAGFMELLCYVFLAWGLAVACVLQFVHAPYGRYSRQGFGVQVPVKLAWFLQELPSVVVPLYLLSFSANPMVSEWRNQVALGLFLLHYVQRTFIFPFLIQGGKPTPLFPFVAAIFFCMLNGYLQAGHLLKYADLQRTVSPAQFYLGVVVFFTGMAINIHSDHILRGLRKKGESGYKIPFGGMFEYVSGANFLGEMTEWIGFAIMCGTLPAFVFAIFTACNIGPRAFQHHRWYLEKFKDYPKSRKALIPYIL